MTPTAPTDDHERLLVHHTHPTDWQNPEPGGRYNLVVVGAGTAGLVCAAGAAGLGARVALVEREFLGGDCVHVGCGPSKALLRAARAPGAVRGAGALGLRAARASTAVGARLVRPRRRRQAADRSRRPGGAPRRCRRQWGRAPVADP